MADRPTLAAVAARAGVSVASASRALSGASASLAMVERVRRAADELGYAVDASGRSLKLGRTDQLVLAVADLSNPAYLAMMRAVESVARDADRRLVLVSTGSDPDAVRRVVRDLNRGYADGLIAVPLRFSPALIEDLRRAPFPVAVMGGLPAGTELDNVRANSARGLGLVVDHLVATGRRRLVLINGPVGTTPGAARDRGFRRAVRRHGLNGATAVETADFTVEAGEKAAGEILSGALAGGAGGGRPDALVCANDLLAVGAVRAARTAGLRVPGDLAITGADGTDLAELLDLTTVDLGSTERGRLIATMLLDRVRDPARPIARVTVQPTLVLRGSTGPATPRPRGHRR